MVAVQPNGDEKPRVDWLGVGGEEKAIVLGRDGWG
jgi:hypothetical protein